MHFDFLYQKKYYLTIVDFINLNFHYRYAASCLLQVSMHKHEDVFIFLPS